MQELIPFKVVVLGVQQNNTLGCNWSDLAEFMKHMVQKGFSSMYCI